MTRILGANGSVSQYSIAMNQAESRAILHTLLKALLESSNKTRIAMKHVVALLSSILFISPALAFEGSDDERFCYANIMEMAIEENWFLFPQTIRKYCSCFYEMEKVGLSSDRCARWEYIPVDEVEG